MDSSRSYAVRRVLQLVDQLALNAADLRTLCVELSARSRKSPPRTDAAAERFRRRFKKLCDLADDTIAHHYTDDPTGHAEDGIACWQAKRPDDLPVARYLRTATVGDLRARGEVWFNSLPEGLEHLETVQNDAPTLMVLHDEGVPVPGRSKEVVLGWYRWGEPVWSSGPFPRHIWTGHDGKRYFPPGTT